MINIIMGDEQRPTPLKIECKTTETGEIEPCGFSFDKQYIAEMRVYVKFWARPENLNRDAKEAEKMLLRCLYRDVLHRTSTLKSIALSYDDPVDLIEEINNLERDLGL